MPDDKWPERPFLVALSFPSEYRAFVERVAERLGERVGRLNVFYDEWYETELAGRAGDLKLMRVYGEMSDLVVPFFSTHYLKPWCKLEWDTMRSLLLEREDDAVFAIKMDDGDIPGWRRTDFWVPWDGRDADEIAELIHRKIRQTSVPVDVPDQHTITSPPAPSADRGHLKPVSLPYPSLGALFKGRDEFLKQLRQSLQRAGNGHATAIVGKAVHGLGGVGKTRLAVEYAWQHQDDYSAVLFLTADSPENLQSNLAELVGPLALDLPEQNLKEQQAKLGASLRWLHDHPGWLIVADNVDTEEAAQAVEDLLNSRARLQDKGKRLGIARFMKKGFLTGRGFHTRRSEKNPYAKDGAETGPGRQDQAAKVASRDERQRVGFSVPDHSVDGSRTE